jgi:hypothetical protein
MSRLEEERLALFDALIEQDEGTTLDFKEKLYPKKNAQLLHDILCLANASSPTDRYLVFGVEDKTKRLMGIEPEQATSFNQANIIDWLQGVSLNRQPSVSLFKIHKEAKTFYVLEIKNSPLKPFCLTKDLISTEKPLNGNGAKTTVKANAIYVRTQDVNTPINSTASEQALELIWRERFGLNKSPLGRLCDLLNPERVDQWKRLDDPSLSSGFYHEEYPEFTIAEPIVEYGEGHRPSFQEDWTSKTDFPDKYVGKYKYYLKYHTTVLKTVDLLSLDGARYYAPLPTKQVKTLDGERGLKVSTYSFEDSTPDEILALRLGYLLTWDKWNGCDSNIKIENVENYKAQVLEKCNLATFESAYQSDLPDLSG